MNKQLTASCSILPLAGFEPGSLPKEPTLSIALTIYATQALNEIIPICLVYITTVCGKATAMNIVGPGWVGTGGIPPR